MAVRRVKGHLHGSGEDVTQLVTVVQAAVPVGVRERDGVEELADGLIEGRNAGRSPGVTRCCHGWQPTGAARPIGTVGPY